MAIGKFFKRSKGEESSDQETVATEETADAPAEKKRGFAALLKRGLSKTRNALTAILPFGKKLDEDALEEITASLIQADFGPTTALALTDDLRDAYKDKEFDREEIVPFLKQRIAATWSESDREIHFAAEGPTVIFVVATPVTLGTSHEPARTLRGSRARGWRIDQPRSSAGRR